MMKYALLSARWHKVWADLWANKLRTALVVSSITVGVFVVGMIYGTNLIFKRDLIQNWLTASPANASLYADSFNEGLVESVRNLRGVKEAEGRRNLYLRVLAADGQWRQMVLIAIPDYNKQKVNIVRPQTGAWPPKDGDILLERSSLAELGVVKGDRIFVETTTGYIRSMKVTGIVYDPSQHPSLFSGSFYGYICMDTLEKLDESRQLNQINLLVEPWLLQGGDVAGIASVGRRAWGKIENSNITVFSLQTYRPGEHPLQNIIDAMILLLTVLGFLALLLGTFLLINTVSAILAQQIRQVGVMKAIGATRAQIFQMYLTLVGVYGVLALIAAVPLGALTAKLVTNFIAKVFNFDCGHVEFPVQVILLETVVAILVPIAAAIWPVWRGVGITVREAVSDYGISGAESNHWLDHWVDNGLKYLQMLPRPVTLSLRNTFRRKGRLFLTLLTLMLAGMVFIAVFSVRASLYSTLDKALEYFHYDIAVSFTQSYRSNRIEQTVLMNPNVRAVESWGFSSGRVLKDEKRESEEDESKGTTILAPPVETNMIKPKVIEGRWFLEGDENAVVVNTEVLKDCPYLSVGGPAIVKVGDHKLRFTVVGIVQGMLTGPVIYAPYDWFVGAVQEPNCTRSVRIVTEAGDNAEQSAVARDVESQLKKNGLYVQNVDMTWQKKKRVQAQFRIIIAFLLIMAVLLAIVGALGLTGTMGINVLERTREIGIMRAVGASSLDICKIFIIEALCMGLISWLGSVILALPISILLSYYVGILFLHNPLTFSFSFIGIVVWLGLSLVLSLLASLLPAWHASQLSVRAVLNYE